MRARLSSSGTKPRTSIVSWQPARKRPAASSQDRRAARGDGRLGMAYNPFAPGEVPAGHRGRDRGTLARLNARPSSHRAHRSVNPSQGPC